MKTSKTRSMKTYILLELGELLLIVVVLIVVSRFIHIPLWLAIAITAGKFLKFIIVCPFVRRSLRQPILSGIESLIGARGLAIRDLDPEGYVTVQGELWKAVVNSAKIPAGVEIEVCGLDETKLVVKELAT